MNELFRKVMCSERLPDETGKYDTNKEHLEYNAKLKFWMINPTYQDDPKYWFEPVKEPTDEEIEAKAKKKWGTIKGRFAFRQGYKTAIEDLKGGKK